MTQFEANIFPVYDFSKENNAETLKSHIAQMGYLTQTFADAPLSQGLVITLAKAEVNVDGEDVVLEDVQFIVTRRFTMHGELHLGGANGEVLNAYLFASNFKRACEERIAQLTAEQ